MTNPFDTVDDSYNPFAMSGTYNETQPQQTTTNTYSPDPTPSYDYPSSTPADQKPAGNGSNDTFRDAITGVQLTEKDIAAREAALAAREKKIADRERQIEDARANGTLDDLNKHKKNFPILISFYKYYPEEEIPSDAIPNLEKIKWLTYGGLIVLLLNAIISLFTLAPGASSQVDSASATIVFAFVYLIVGYPLSLELVLFVLYNSLKQGKALKYIGFLFTFAIFFAFFVYLAIGIGDWGSLGWITSINLLGAEQNTWVGIIAIIFSIICTIFCVATAWMWWVCFRYFRTTDLQKKAIGEAAVTAGNFAMDHREEIAQAARDNPEVAMQAASFAAAQSSNNQGFA